MKIVFVGDNRDRLNWGCRATSIALKNLLQEKNEIIHTIHGDITLKKERVLSGRILSAKANRLISKLQNRFRIANWILNFIGVKDTVNHNVNQSISLFYKVSKTNATYSSMINAIKESDAVVVNGEGSFIFTTPYRRDTIFYLVLLKIAQQLGKKTFCINMMVSDCPKSGCNAETLGQTIEVLSQCDGVYVRDPASMRYLQQRIGNSNLQYIPDALFNWGRYTEQSLKFIGNFTEFAVPFPEHDASWVDFNFKGPYICISGSSSAAWDKNKAIESYSKLVLELKKLNHEIIIVPTCLGDSFLCDVATNTKTKIIPPNINILAGMSVLGNAEVFVSGRWHPSILASLCGVPCVFMGSNSHKTKSLQEMLEYSDVREYNSIPNTEEIMSIAEDVKKILCSNKKTDNTILNIAHKLRTQTEEYINIIK